MGERHGQRPAFGRAERAGFLADEDDGWLAALAGGPFGCDPLAGAHLGLRTSPRPG